MPQLVEEPVDQAQRAQQLLQTESRLWTSAKISRSQISFLGELEQVYSCFTGMSNLSFLMDEPEEAEGSDHFKSEEHRLEAGTDLEIPTG